MPIEWRQEPAETRQSHVDLENAPVILSIDESIQKLKAEILSPDWSLPQKKIEPLEAAFTCLKNRFKTRKNVLAILTMADSVLQYAKKNEQPLAPDFVDFLKETMAHIVNIYEESKFDPDREEQLFKRVYSRFTVLKGKVKTQKAGSPAAAPASKPTPEKPAAPQAGDRPQASSPQQPRPPVAREEAAMQNGEPNTTLPVPGILVQKLSIGDMLIGIPVEQISLARPLNDKKKKGYIKNSLIPVKDFGSLFKSLSGQFLGELSGLKDSRLKKLVLPLIMPRGLGLPILPDEGADTLLVLSSGSWHGALIGRGAKEESQPLKTLQKGKNGDLLGTAILETNEKVPLLNVQALLEREGFLSVPE